MFSRRLGERFNRGRVPTGVSPPIWQQIPGAFAAFRADLGVTLATGVSSWASQVAGGGNLAQATGSKQPTLTASDAALGGKPSLAFASASTQHLVSDLAAASWKFLHDGTGCTIYAPNIPVTTTDGTLLATGARVNAVGARIMHTPASNRFAWQIATGAAYAINIWVGAAAPENTGYGVLSTYATASTPDADLRYPVNTSVGTGSGTPSASDPTGSLHVGAYVGGLLDHFNGRIPELVFWNRYLTAAEIAIVHAYSVGSYGA